MEFMRKNLPVSDIEYPIHDDTMIVSKTDAKGRITFVNDQFIAVSGFPEDELIGKPHNVVRHPDMPPEAFDDLWKTLKAGKPWAGAVKNRRKDGSFYWVFASATPTWEGGQITGYMSIRTKLAQDQREEAERVYSAIREGRAADCRVDSGIIRHRSWKDRLSFFTRTLRARLISIVAVQALFVAAIGGAGLLSLKDVNDRTKTIYEDRTVPLFQLFEVNDGLKQTTTLMYEAAAKGRSGKPVTDTVARISANVDRAARFWAEYQATYLTPEESTLAASFESKKNDFLDNSVAPAVKMIEAHKFDALEMLATEKADAAFAAARSDMEGLLKIQIDVAKEEFDRAQARYLWTFGVVIGVLAVALVAGLGLGWLTMAAIGRPVRRLKDAMERIQQGDYNSRIVVERDDELGHALRDVQATQAKLGFDREEQRARRKITEEEKREALRQMAETVERETNAAVGEVAQRTEHMAGNASQMNESAASLGSNSSSVAAAAEQALANSETLAKAATAMRTSIEQIASQVQSSRMLTIEAVSASQNAQQTISKLSDAATKVGAVTNLISEIAGQTNLLALNATIEAARAGDAGRGFAVVASEVKSLAEQTAKATSEIAQQITEMQTATQDSVASITTIGKVIESIETLSSSISTAMERQDGVTSEIARTVEESAQAAREVATQIVKVSNEAAETGRRAQDIQIGSTDIAGKVAGLRSILVQVVRTSTADVNRRVHDRADLQRTATLEVDGASLRVTVMNVSEGGALIDRVLDVDQVGKSATILIDGIAARLSGVVGRLEDGGTMIKFRLTEAAEKVLKEGALKRASAA